MNEENIFYWLQGYFELTEQQRPLLLKQVACIRKHIDLVHERGDRLKHLANLLEFAADGLAHLDPLTERVRAVVADQFQHVIDPKAGGPTEQGRLNTIHGIGGVDPKTGAVYRC